MIQCRLLPESLHWLVVRGREKEAQLLVKSIARTNGKVMSDFTIKTVKKEGRPNKAGVLDIYHHPVMRQRAAQLICCWLVPAETQYFCYMVASPTHVIVPHLIQPSCRFSCCVMYYALSMGGGDLGGNLYISFSLLGLVEAFSSLPAELLLGR